MKTEVNKIDATKRELNIEVSGEIVKNKFGEVYKKIAKDAKVPGFRPGNAPLDIIQQRFSSLAHEEVLKILIPDVYNDAIAKEGLDVIELPNISDVKLETDTLSFKATVEVSPEIKLINYKGLKLGYQKVSVSADEIKRSLDALKESRKIENIDAGVAKSLGYPDTEELEKAIEKQLFIQKENAQRENLEGEIINALTKGIDFVVPQAMVSRQLQDLVRQAKLDLALKGVQRQKIEEQEKELTKTLEPQAREQVKIYMILAEIAKKENIAIDDHMPRKAMEFLLKEANWQAEA